MSGGKSSSSSDSISSQGVWGPQADALKQMYGQAPGMMQGVQDQMPGLQAGAEQWTQGVQGEAMPAWQNQMAGGNLAGYDIAGGLGNSLAGAMTNPTQQQQALNTASNGGQNYSDAYKQNFVNDARTAMDASMQGIDARAAASGAGGSAYGNAMARGHQDINKNLQSNLANVGYQDYNNQVNRMQQAGAGADQNLLQQQGMMSNLLGQQQGAQAGALQQTGAMNQLGQAQMGNALMPINAYSQMLQSMGGPVVLTDSMSDSSQSSRQGGL